MRIEVDPTLEFNETTSAQLRRGHLVQEEARLPAIPAAPPRARRRLVTAGRLFWLIILAAALAAWFKPEPKVHPGARASRPAVSDRCRPEVRTYNRAQWWQAARAWINIRQGPGPGHPDLGVIGQGALARVIGPLRGAWLPVRAGDGTEGFVRASLGTGLGPLRCGELRPPAGTPVCERPGQSCRHERRTAAGERWAAAAASGPRGWQPVYLTPARKVWLAGSH